MLRNLLPELGRPRKWGGFFSLLRSSMTDDRLVRLLVTLTIFSVLLSAGVFVMLLFGR